MHTITSLRKSLGEPSGTGSAIVPLAGDREQRQIAVVTRDWQCGCRAMRPYAARTDLEDMLTQYEPCPEHEHGFPELRYE